MTSGGLQLVIISIINYYLLPIKGKLVFPESTVLSFELLVRQNKLSDDATLQFVKDNCH